MLLQQRYVNSVLRNAGAREKRKKACQSIIWNLFYNPVVLG